MYQTAIVLRWTRSCSCGAVYQEQVVQQDRDDLIKELNELLPPSAKRADD